MLPGLYPTGKSLEVDVNYKASNLVTVRLPPPACNLALSGCNTQTNNHLDCQYVLLAVSPVFTKARLLCNQLAAQHVGDPGSRAAYKTGM